MSGVARAADGLDRTVSLLERTARVLVLTVVIVALVCVSGLIIAATFGILHNGDDFDFDRGGGGRVDSDLIHVPAGLSWTHQSG